MLGLGGKREQRTYPTITRIEIFDCSRSSGDGRPAPAIAFGRHGIGSPARGTLGDVIGDVAAVLGTVDGSWLENQGGGEVGYEQKKGEGEEVHGDKMTL